MGRKRTYTVERLKQIGLQSAEKFKRSLPPHVVALADVHCDYVADLLDDGSSDQTPHDCHAKVDFRWKAVIPTYENALSFEVSDVVQVKCSKAKFWGVPLPNNWWRSLRCASMQALAHTYAKSHAHVCTNPSTHNSVHTHA